MNAGFQYHIAAYGEHGWIAQLNGTGDPVAAALYVNAVADALRAQDGVIDSVAGVDSLVIRADPLTLRPENARTLLEETLARTAATPGKPGKHIEIPVCYGGAFGPDLNDVSELTGLSPEAIIKAHAQGPYRVLTIGFAPGFAYLGPLDPRLEAPRLDTPRARLPAGSVGVAGATTGIYPLSSPGGWRIIGRTPAKLFDPQADEPFTLSAGDEVRFTVIDEEKFLAMSSANV